MPEPTEVVGVLRVHLEEMAAALGWTANYFRGLDLVDGYRQGKPTLRPSRTTVMVERALQHAEGYLGTEDE